MGGVTPPDVLFSDVQNAVNRHQPELSVVRSEQLIILEGKFLVYGRDGPVDTPDGVFDSYKIWAGVAEGFPNERPVVLETGGRIPRIADRHVFPQHGTCCLGVWEEWLLKARDHRFETFLTGLMHNYFLSQSHYEVHGDWPFGDRSHGMLGILEAYSDILGLPSDEKIIAEDEKIIADYLRILSRRKIKGHALCPCGSGRRLRQCHSDDIQNLSQKIPPRMAKQMYRNIASA